MGMEMEMSRFLQSIQHKKHKITKKSKGCEEIDRERIGQTMMIRYRVVK